MPKKNYPVDSAKLSAHMKARKLSKTLVSQEMGYSPSYLSHCMDYGRIGVKAALILEARYGICPDDYDPGKPFELTSEAGSLSPAILRDLIDYAVAKALKEIAEREIVLSIRTRPKEGEKAWTGF